MCYGTTVALANSPACAAAVQLHHLVANAPAQRNASCSHHVTRLILLPTCLQEPLLQLRSICDVSRHTASAVQRRLVSQQPLLAVQHCTGVHFEPAQLPVRHWNPPGACIHACVKTTGAQPAHGAQCMCRLDTWCIISAKVYRLPAPMSTTCISALGMSKADLTRQRSIAAVRTAIMQKMKLASGPFSISSCSSLGMMACTRDSAISSVNKGRPLMSVTPEAFHRPKHVCRQVRSTAVHVDQSATGSIQT